MLRQHLVSETGLVYTLLAHAAGRLSLFHYLRRHLKKRRQRCLRFLFCVLMPDDRFTQRTEPSPSA